MTSKLFRILPIKLTFHFNSSWQASYFAVQRRPERKREKIHTCSWRDKLIVLWTQTSKNIFASRKHLHGSGEIAKKKKDWKKMEGK